MGITESVSTAVSTGKKLLELPSLAKNVEAKLLIADLQLQLAEVKSTVADLTNENRELKEQLRKKDDAPKVTKHGNVYHVEGRGQEPFCTACYDSRKQLSTLSIQNGLLAKAGKYHCNVCQASYF